MKVLPNISPWIQWAREVKYNAYRLCNIWGMTDEQFYMFTDVILFKTGQQWLDEIRYCDTAYLIHNGKSFKYIEELLEIENKSKFWKGYEKYHSCNRERFKNIYQHTSARHSNDISCVMYNKNKHSYIINELNMVYSKLIPTKIREIPIPCPDNNVTVSDILLCLHYRICQGCDKAKDAFAYIAWNPLRTSLMSQWTNIDDHNILEAIGQAINKYINNPLSYNNNGHNIYQYIRLIAWRRIYDILRRDQREKSRRINGIQLLYDNKIDECPVYPSPLIEIINNEIKIEQNTIYRLRRQWMNEHVSKMKPAEQKIANLMIDGEKRMDQYAKILRIEQYDIKEQKRIINKEKNKIYNKLKRWLRKTMYINSSK